jgi:hypothetical protein
MEIFLDNLAGFELVSRVIVFLLLFFAFFLWFIPEKKEVPEKKTARELLLSLVEKQLESGDKTYDELFYMVCPTPPLCTKTISNREVSLYLPEVLDHLVASKKVTKSVFISKGIVGPFGSRDTKTQVYRLQQRNPCTQT